MTRGVKRVREGVRKRGREKGKDVGGEREIVIKEKNYFGKG